MRCREILARPGTVLTEEQRRRYFEEGYLQLPGFIGMDWIERLRAAADEFVEQSRQLTESSDALFLEPGHRPERPRLLRLNQAVDHHPVFWEFATGSLLPDLAADLVGPDVKFRESTINFKCAEGGSQVHWHQDVPFFPHTNLDLFVAITYLEEVRPDQAPLMVLPGSHRREIFNHRDRDGSWLGRISDEDLARLPLGDAVALTGPAGTVSVIHTALVHGSESNLSKHDRPVLIPRLPRRGLLRLHALPAAHPLHEPAPARRSAPLRLPRARRHAHSARLVGGLHVDIREPGAVDLHGSGARLSAHPGTC